MQFLSRNCLSPLLSSYENNAPDSFSSFPPPPLHSPNRNPCFSPKIKLFLLDLRDTFIEELAYGRDPPLTLLRFFLEINYAFNFVYFPHDTLLPYHFGDQRLGIFNRESQQLAHFHEGQVLVKRS